MEPLPVEAYTYLVKNLSREGDTVVDVGSKRGYAMVASLKKVEMQCGWTPHQKADWQAYRQEFVPFCEAAKLKVGNLQSILG